MRWSVQVLLLPLVLAACAEELSPTDLIGRYYLYINSEYTNPSQPNDVLVLNADGTFQQSFTDQSGSQRTNSGTWRFDGRRVVLVNWRDYAGFTSLKPVGERALNYSAPTEGRPPVIVLEGDRNIFYSREPKRGLK